MWSPWLPAPWYLWYLFWLKFPGRQWHFVMFLAVKSNFNIKPRGGRRYSNVTNSDSYSLLLLRMGLNNADTLITLCAVSWSVPLYFKQTMCWMLSSTYSRIRWIKWSLKWVPCLPELFFFHDILYVEKFKLIPCCRTNSTILAKTAKNKRKAEKKRKAIERRVSEGDAQSVDVSKAPLGRTTSQDPNDESHDDSGLASSFEEAVVLGGGANGGGGGGSQAKLKKKTKKRTKQFEMSNDLIFDLDI